MIRFLLGIILVQIATVALVLLAPELHGFGWLRLFIPLLVIGFFAAFWFSSMAKHKTKDEVSAATEQHAREKEKIQLNAERAKTRLVKKTQEQIAKESRSAHNKANFKVGAAFAGTIGMGALMLLTELLTLGLLTISTAGGALGGYVWRSKKGSKNLPYIDKNISNINNDGDNTIDGSVKVIKNK